MILSLLTVIAVLLSTVLRSYADMGGFSGNSSYGGGGGGGGGGGSSHGGSGGSAVGIFNDYLPEEWGMPIAVIFVVVWLILWIKLSKNNKSSSKAQGATMTPLSKLRSISEFKALDPNFDADAYTKKLGEMYVDFQKHWQAKDLSPMRGYMTDAFYAQMDRQLDQLRQANVTNIVENIDILAVELRGFMQDDTNDILSVSVRTCINDYYIDGNTGEITRGSDKDTRKFMTYEWTMIRRKGVLTEVGDGEKSEQNCPNCGAPLSVNHSAQCEYCGSIITNSDYDWVLSNIKGISQRNSKSKK